MLRYNLEKQGFRVEEAADGQEALTRIAETQPDLVLLDWMLPVMSGHRGLPPDPPPPGDPRPAGHHGDRAHRGPGRGARPEHRRRRLHHQAVQHGRAAGPHARAAAPLQRRAGEGAAGLPRHRRWTWPRIACSATAGRCISGPTEFRLLEFFMQHPRRVFSREELLDAVWGPRHPCRAAHGGRAYPPAAQVDQRRRTSWTWCAPCARRATRWIPSRCRRAQPDRYTSCVKISTSPTTEIPHRPVRSQGMPIR